MKHSFVLLLLIGFIIGCDNEENEFANNDITVSFAEAASAFGENDGEQTITVNLSEAATEEVTVQVDISGNATLGGDAADYTLDPAPNEGENFITLTIPEGQDTASITVTPVVDGVEENNETIILTLVDNNTSDNLVLGTNTVHTATLADNTIAVSFAEATSAFGENDGEQTITVNLSETATEEVTVQVDISGNATLGEDYTLDPAPNEGENFITLTIPEGQDTASITITPVVDGVSEEENETIILTLVDNNTSDNLVLGTNTVHTATLADNTIAVSFEAATSAFGENDGEQTITVNLSETATEEVTVQVDISGNATLGEDYTLDPAPNEGENFITLTIPEGQDTASITVTPVVDGVEENNETIILTLVDNNTSDNLVLGTNTVHTATLADNTIAVSFAEATSAFGENAGNQTINLSLSGTLSQTATVQVVIDASSTATLGANADYTLNPAPDGSGVIELTIEPNQPLPSITIIPIIDGISGEGNETIILDLVDDDTSDNLVLGTNDVHTATLQDTTPVIGFTATSSTLNEEASNPQTITLNLVGTVSQAVTVNVEVDLSDSEGLATLDSDYTLNPAPDGNGIITLTINPNQPLPSIDITVINDALIEGNENVILTLLDPNSDLVLDENSEVHTVTLEDPVDDQ